MVHCNRFFYTSLFSVYLISIGTLFYGHVSAGVFVNFAGSLHTSNIKHNKRGLEYASLSLNQTFVWIRWKNNILLYLHFRDKKYNVSGKWCLLLRNINVVKCCILKCTFLQRTFKGHFQRGFHLFTETHVKCVCSYSRISLICPTIMRAEASLDTVFEKKKKKLLTC